MRSTDGKAKLLFRAFNTDLTEIRKKEKIVSKMTANDGQKQTFSSTEKQEKEKIRRDRMDKCEREKKMEFSGPALYEQGEEIRQSCKYETKIYSIREENPFTRGAVRIKNYRINGIIICIICLFCLFLAEL